MAQADGSVIIDTVLDKTGLTEGLEGLSQKASSALSLAVKGVAALSTALVAAGGYAVKTGMEFDTAVSQIAATMGKSVDEIDALGLSDKAKELGASTKFTATEAAEGLNILAMAGLDANQQLAGIDTVLNLASAGAMSLEDAASYTTGAVKGFGDSMDNAQKYADLMAKGATLANTDVRSLGEAMGGSAAMAKSYGQDVNSMTVALLKLAESNVTGSEAATALNRAMTDLYAPHDRAAKAMKKLGISAYDSKGNAKDLNVVMGELNAKLSTMSAEEANAYKNTIFTAQGMKAFNMMCGVSTERAEEFAEGLEHASDGLGAAADQAHTQIDNLEGDVTIFKSALQGLALEAYEVMNGSEGTLRDFVQTGTDLLGELTEATKTGGLSGLAEALGSVLSKALSKLSEYAPKVVDMAIKVVKGFATGIADAAPQIAESAATIIESLVTGIGDTLPIIVEAISKLLISAMNSLTKSIPKISQSLKKAVKSIAQTITKFAPELVKSGHELLQAIGKGIAENGPEIVKDILTSILTIKTSITKIKGDLIKVGWQIVQAIGDGLVEALPDIVNGLPELLESALNNVLTNISMGFSTLSNVFSSLLDALPGAIQEFGKNLPGMISNMFSNLQGCLATVTAAGKQLLEALIKDFPLIIDALKEALSNVDWVQLFTDIVNTIISTLDTLIPLVGELLATIWDTIVNIDWAGLGSKIWEIIKSGFNAVGDWIKKLVLGDSYTPDSTWADVGGKLWEAIKSGITAVGDWIKKLVLGDDYTPEAGWSEVGAKLWEAIKSGIVAVGDWIKKLVLGDDYSPDASWGEVGAKLWETIKSGIVAVGDWIKKLVLGDEYSPDASWSEVGAKLWETIKSGIVAVGDWIKKLVLGDEYSPDASWAQVGAKIWETIKSGIKAVGDWIKSLVLGSEFTPDSTWGDVGKKIWDTICGGFKVVGDWIKKLVMGSEYTPDASWLDIGKKIWEKIKEGLGNIAAGMADIATNIWNGLKDGLTTAWNTLKDTICKPFQDVIDWVKGLFGIASPSTVFSEIGGFLLEGLKAGLEAAYNLVIEPIKKVFQGIWDVIKSIFGFGGESEESKEAKQAGKDIMTGLKEGVTGNEEDMKRAVKDAGTNALKELRGALGVPDSGGSSTKTKPYGEAIVKGVQDGVDGKATAENLKGNMTKVANAIKQALNDALKTDNNGKAAGEVKNQGQGVVKGVTDGIDSKANKNEFKTSMNALRDAAKGALNDALGISEGGNSASQLKTQGEAIVNGVKEAFENKATKDTFSSAANACKNAALEALKSALGIGGGLFSDGAASQFESVGKAICDGVAKGINSNTSTIKSAAQSAARAALAAAKKELGISSPSKAFAEVGRYIGSGLAKGMDQSTREIELAAQDMADAVYDRMRSAVDMQTAKNSDLFSDVTGAINAQSDSIRDAVDLDQLAEKIWEKAPDIDVKIDGRTAGHLLEPYVSQEQGNKTNLKNRRNGNV